MATVSLCTEPESRRESWAKRHHCPMRQSRFSVRRPLCLLHVPFELVGADSRFPSAMHGIDHADFWSPVASSSCCLWWLGVFQPRSGWKSSWCAGCPVEDVLAAGCWLLAGCWMLACIRLISCRLSMEAWLCL